MARGNSSAATKTSEASAIHRSVHLRRAKGWVQLQDGEQGLGYYFDSLDKIVRGPAFIPAEKFEGPKPGYRFSNGGQGVGYYIDEKPVVPVSQDGGSGGGSEGLLIGGLIVAAAIAGSPEAQMNIAMKTNGKCCVVS